MPIDLRSPIGVTLALLPVVLLSLWSLVVLLVVLAPRHRGRQPARGWLSVVGVIGAAGATIWLWLSGARSSGVPHMVSSTSIAS